MECRHAARAQGNTTGSNSTGCTRGYDVPPRCAGYQVGRMPGNVGISGCLYLRLFIMPPALPRPRTKKTGRSRFLDFLNPEP